MHIYKRHIYVRRHKRSYMRRLINAEVNSQSVATVSGHMNWMRCTEKLKIYACYDSKRPQARIRTSTLKKYNRNCTTHRPICVCMCTHHIIKLCRRHWHYLSLYMLYIFFKSWATAYMWLTDDSQWLCSPFHSVHSKKMPFIIPQRRSKESALTYIKLFVFV